MNIGEVVKKTGISAKMLRSYEDLGLLTDVARSAAGYRIYTPAHLKTLAFIQHCRELGFRYSSIQELLLLWHNEHRKSRAVKALTEQHIQALESKIAELQHMVMLLKNSVQSCAGNDGAECSILQQLEQQAAYRQE